VTAGIGAANSAVQRSTHKTILFWQLRPLHPNRRQPRHQFMLTRIKYSRRFHKQFDRRATPISSNSFLAIPVLRKAKPFGRPRVSARQSSLAAQRCNARSKLSCGSGSVRTNSQTATRCYHRWVSKRQTDAQCMLAEVNSALLLTAFRS
jgi:hypothetical protein